MSFVIVQSCSTEEEESVAPVVQTPQPEPEPDPVEYSLTVSAADGGTGLAFADQSGYNITLTAMEPRPIFEVESSDGTLLSALDGITVS